MSVRMMMQGRQPAGGGGTFSPLDLATLSAWYDASDAGSFTYSSGTVVSQWDDLGPNGYHLSSSGAAQPSRNRTLNSLDVVDFGGSQYISRASAPVNNSSNGTWTIFAVVDLDTVSGTRSIVDGDDTGSNRIGQFIRTNGTTSEVISFGSGGVKTDAGPSVATGACILRSVCTASNVEVFVDAVGNGATSLGGTQTYSATARLTLGSLSDLANSRMDGGIAEVICCSSALGSTDIDDTETYLADKWGITL